MKRIWTWIVVLCLLAGAGTSVGAAEKNTQLIIINKATNKLAFYQDGKLIKSFPVATGKQQTYTPEGTFEIVNKIKNRPYYKGKIAGGDPKNPLGDRWLGLNARGTKGDTYGIHGNNNEKSIGSYVSLGCVRMRNQDVRWLFDQVKVKTPVIITTSKLSFADIAKSKNFTVEAEPTPTKQPAAPVNAPLEKVDVRLTLTKKAALYRKPGVEPTPHALSPQPIQAFEKQGDWYRVKTWTGDLWLYADQVLIGEAKPVDKKIRVDQYVPIFEQPLVSSRKLGGLSPQVVSAFEEWNGWYRIQSFAGEVWFDGRTAWSEVPVTIAEPGELPVELSSDQPSVHIWNEESFVYIPTGHVKSAWENRQEVVVTIESGGIPAPAVWVKLEQVPQGKGIRFVLE
ncbi:L,D-transpeptidase [Ammoniphilus sp. YIM 78166]|uniref:L,D-transpeptidase n=1 Tax=Ammoniphilus sp. YIM 78166 TaxID=1644106 RepID=UPI00106FBAD7|nr:L,D-transpeptidase [Ammoniphilus sp. YIM 78166]